MVLININVSTDIFTIYTYDTVFIDILLTVACSRW